MTEKLRILVLGGGGFLGHNLARRLLECGHHVTRLDSRPMHSVAVQDHMIVGDMSNPNIIEPLLHACDTVLHLASATTPSSSAAHPLMEAEVNIGPTLRLLEVAQQTELQHLIFISSGGTVYGNPANLPASESEPLAPHSYHAAGKVALEAFLHAYQHLSGKVVTILRPSNLYGPEQALRSGFGIIRTMLEHVRTGQLMTIWGDGENVRDYLYIDDMVAACCTLIERGRDNGTFNIGAGVGTSINQLHTLIEQLTAHRIPVQHLPARPQDVQSIVLDSTKFTHVTEWLPTTRLDDGIKRTWEWLSKC